MRTKHILTIILLIGCMPLAFADVKGSFSKTLNVSGKPDVEIQTGSGNITVRVGNASTVQVNAKIHASESWFGDGGMSASERVKRIEQDPPVKQNGNMISIGRIEERELRNHVSIDYEVTVPAGSSINSRTGSGDQDINGVNGALRATTGSGNIRVDSVTGDPRLETGSGDIKIDAVKGRLYAHTGSGNITAKSVDGGLNAETGSGDIEYYQTAAGTVLAHTGSGNIRLHGVKGGVEAHTGSGDVDIDGEATSAWDVETGSGNLNLRLPQNAAFDLRAQSSSGSIQMNRPVTVQGILKRNRVEGKVGNGGPLLSLHTGSGDIRID
jgi:DUF4097 and DUF4098 domain-containing protein YvlB